MTPEVLLIIWRLNVYHHISFCLLVASISSSWLLCMAQHISFWGFLMKISREYGGVVPKMRTTNEHIGGGLWPEMYGTSESHISPRYSDSLYTTIRKLSFVWRGRSSSFYSNFSLFGWERDFFMWWCWWNFVLCDLLHFEWRMITSYKSSLAASCHRIKTSTTATDRTIFQSCRNTTKRNRETTRPTWENYYSYIMNAPTSRILDLWTVERLHQICQR